MQASAKQSCQEETKRVLPDLKRRAAILCLITLSLWEANAACTSNVPKSPPPTVHTVGSNADSAGGSLREAINSANKTSGTDIINFNLRSNALRIELKEPLPPIRNGVTINGFNKSGGRVELDGTNAGSNANGLTIIGSGNTIRGLVIQRFSGYGILISGRISGEKAIGNQVVDNFIGTDAGGIKGPGNGKDGVFVDLNSSDNLIARNRIAHNKCNGVNLPDNETSKGFCERLPADKKYPPPVRIAIRENLIFANRGISIDLGNDGRTPNGEHKGEPTGPNNWQPFPVLTQSARRRAAGGKSGFGFAFSVVSARAVETTASAPAVTITINGTITGQPNQCYTVEFYYQVGCPEITDADLGSVLIGRKRDVCTDNKGEGSFIKPITLQNSDDGGFVNATATDATGNSSEFSDCVTWKKLSLLRPRGPYTTAGSYKSGQPYHHPRS